MTQPAIFSASLAEEVRQRRLPVEADSRRFRCSGPGAMWYMDSISLSEASLSAEIERSRRTTMPQAGDGLNMLTAAAAAYRVLSQRQRLWGRASFTTGEYRGIRYSDAIDYRKVAPYVLGDSVGGNLSWRRYCLSGGYALAYSALTFGVAVEYRAEIASRDRDPRVKTVVSDLNASLGASAAVTRAYVASAALFLESYTQNCEVDFYNPVNDIQTYPFTGMGTRYERFAGNTNKSSGHESTAYGASVSLFPTGSKGLYASAEYRGYRMGMRLRGFNNITMAYTDNTVWSAEAAVRLTPSGSVALMPQLGARMLRRKGTENLFGTAAGASYDKIGSRSPYRYNLTTATLHCPVQVTAGRCIATATPFVHYLLEEERYTSGGLRHRQERLQAGAALNLSGTWHGDRLWEAEAAGSNEGASAMASISWTVSGVLAWTRVSYRYLSQTLGSRGNHNAFVSIGTTF